MAPPRRPRDPNRPKPPRADTRDTAEKRAKSPSAAARDARRAEQHAAARPPRVTPPREPAQPAAADRRRKPAGQPGRTAKPDRAASPRTPERASARAAPHAGGHERVTKADRSAPRSSAHAPRRAATATTATTERPRRPASPRTPAPPRTVAEDRPRDTARPPRASVPDRTARHPAERAPPRPDRPDRGERPAFATRAGRAAATRPNRTGPRRDAPPAPRLSAAEPPRRGAARHQRAAPTPRGSASEAPGEGQRIAKLLARAGIASRREIERMIAEGRVAIGGVAIGTAATILKSLHDVTVDGSPVQAAAPARLFRYHKPAGLLTAERDPAGRATIYDRLPPGLPRLIPVGRLDLNTEGLLLLTTDGELKRQLELPASGVERTYRARVFGEIGQAQLEDLIDGIEIEGVRYGAIDANLERRTGRNAWLEMKLREGKNREVRRVLEYLGLQVSRLIRTAYGPFLLAELAPGDVDEVRQHDLVAFRKSLKQPS